ncbi:DUF3068 domain-containing protein [Williamsia sterculiae]|uniref:DUF3068 domain-containing protein n=1 Tax=Williamsia sterculiae TaxID=1344003 RepID=A0A1N7CE68_9NOCA|nr:DUF3068 domain-containing protein [Williamsia sterculiae]SIR61908.1 Protein of unknown function [Williamsia sterculiae]
MAAGRLSVKDLVGPALIFLGVLLIALAIALPLYFVGVFKKTPMDYDLTTVATSEKIDGSDGTDALPAKLLNPCSIKARKSEVSPANLTRQQRVVAVEPASGSKVTLQAGQSTQLNQIQNGNDTVSPTGDGTDGSCPGSLLGATVDRVTVDRETGRPNSAGGGSSELQVTPPTSSGDAAPTVSVPDRTGFQYRFPFDTKRSNKYKYFDLTTRSAHDLKYVDSAEVRGVKTYHFTQDVPETDLSQLQDANGQQVQGTVLSKPASWFGTFKGVDPKQELPATLFYQATRDLYVNPDTGTIVNMVEHVQENYKFSGFSDDAPAALKNYSLTNLDAKFAYDQKTQEATAKQARDLDSPLSLWGRWLPIVAAILGVLALLAGLFFLFRGGRGNGGGQGRFGRVASGGQTAAVTGAAGAGAAGAGAAVAHSRPHDDTTVVLDKGRDVHGNPGAQQNPDVYRADPDATQNIPRVTDEHGADWDYRHPDHGTGHESDDDWRPPTS